MGKALEKVNHTLFFCDGGSCRKAGSEAVIRAVRADIRNSGKWNEIHTVKTRCNGRCEDAPTVIVAEGYYWYKNLTPEKGIAILKSHYKFNKPIEKYLLYAKNWESVSSSNERKQFIIKPFEWKNDQQLGRCLMTKGLSSDQYLYPLFDYLFKNAPEARIELANKEVFKFGEIIHLTYNKEYELDLKFNNRIVAFVIAPIPKDQPELDKRKITSATYFYQERTKEVGVRLTNKKNELIAYLFLGKPDTTAWEYCKQIQLQNNKLELSNV